MSKTKRTSYDIIEQEALRFCRQSAGAGDIVAFFYQKYEFEEEWWRQRELIYVDYGQPNPHEYKLSFNNDFCEGQTCVKDITFVYLDDVLRFYDENMEKELKQDERRIV